MKKFFNKKTFALVMLSILVCAVMSITASADYQPITVSETGITLENDHVVYSFNSKGLVTKYAFKDNGINYLGSKSYFAILSTEFDDIYITQLKVNSIEEDTVYVTAVFDASGVELDFSITVYDDFFLFKLLEEVPKGYTELSMNSLFLSTLHNGTEFATFSYALDYNTKMGSYPSYYAKNRNLVCRTYRELGNAGLNATFAVVGCPVDEYYDVLRFIADFVADPTRVAVSKMGGAYAKTEEVKEIAVQDYVIISSNPSDEAIRFWLEYNVTQFDFHQGNSTFLQGSMDFVESIGDTPEGFKTQVGDRIKRIAKEEYGKDAVLGLHTYAYYISPNNTALLSDPANVQMLEYFEDEIYTVSSAVDKTQTSIPVFEDTSNFKLETGFFVYNSQYIRIDDEIMLVSATMNNGFRVTRGMCGTSAASHRKGASVYHLTGLFGMLAPQIDSQLFVDIAKYTAQAYVKGGFGMIYIDALDGIGRHTTDYSWYYCGKFVTEIMKEINNLRDNFDEYVDVRDPIFEYSSMTTSIWGVRTRTGANDTVCRAIKDFIAYHTKNNATNIFNYTTNIGWYALYNAETVRLSNGIYANDGPFITQMQTWDTIDLLGKNIIAHNMGYSYNNFNLSAKDVPIHINNADVLLRYLKLRDEGYFTNEVINTISDYRDEWKLIEKDGEYGFEHRDYNEIKFNTLTDTKTANNPFAAQVPKVIRIQSLFTDGEAEYITVADMDEASIESISNIEATSGGYRIEFANAIDLDAYKALVVRIYGNGQGGKFNVTMQTEDATISRVVELDFVGWKDVVLAEVDNGINDHEFNTSGGYPFNRNIGSVAKEMTLKVSGDMTGVKLDTVKVSKSVYSNITNPGISYNGSSVVFNTTITNGEFVEFDGTVATHYDMQGNPTEITFTKTGDLTAPEGDFDITMLGTGSDYVDRAWLTIGFGGEQIFNDLSAEAVESIVVKTAPKNTSYTVGQTLDTTGLSIYELMNTGRTRDVDGGWSVEGVTFTEAGIHKIPVTYNGFSTTFTVVVHEVAPVSLEIVTPAEKTVFYSGEVIDTTGLELELTYNNGNVETVTSGYTVYPEKFTQAGENTVYVTCDGFTVSYEVNVMIPSLLSLSITQLPTKTSYEAGEIFSTAGMVVTGNYSAGITAEITDYTYTPNGPLTVGVSEVVIEKNGYTVNCPITVTAPADDTKFTVSSADVVAVPGSNFETGISVKAGKVTTFESLEYTVCHDPRLVYNGATSELPEGWEIWEVVDGANGQVKIAVIDEGSVPVPVTAEELKLTLNFTIPTTVANGESMLFEIVDVSASDDSFSYVEGEGSSFEVFIDTKISLVSDSKYIIDRERGLLFMSHAETTVEEFKSNFTSDVAVSTTLALVGTGTVVSLEVDGVAVDSLTVVLPGDASGNGKIDSADYLFAKRGYTGALALTVSRALGADANRNGFVDTSDYLLIKKHVEGEIDIFE